MSLNRHKTFSYAVEQEFKRRESDFGVRGHSGNLLSPVDDEPSGDVWKGQGGRSVWVRVSSGVVGFRKDQGDGPTEVSEVDTMGGIKTISTRVNGSSTEGRINGIVLETKYEGKDFYGVKNRPGFQSVAKVLFADKNGSNLLNDEATLDVFSDRGQPGPVVESVSVKHNGSWGQIKEATVRWRVFSQEHFETLSYFLCNLQKTVVLEFGWSSHTSPPQDLTDIKNIRNLQSNQSMALVRKNDADYYQKAKDSISKIRTNRTRSGNDFDFDSLKPYEVELERRGTDYDIFIGIIKNYDISLEDGAYVVTTTLISGAPAIIASRNGNIFTSYFNKQFNADIDKLSLAKDPRVWQRKVQDTSPNSDTSDKKVPERITDEDLSAIQDWWAIMRDESRLIFYDKVGATEDTRSGVRLRRAQPGIDMSAYRQPDTDKLPEINPGAPELKYAPSFITDLQYVSDEELKRAIVRRGRLIERWYELEPDVPNPTAYTVNLILGAVVGGILGGPTGAIIGGGLASSVGEQIASQFMADDVGDNRTFKYIRAMLRSIVEARGDATPDLLNVLSSTVKETETATNPFANSRSSFLNPSGNETLSGKDVYYHFDDLDINPYDWLDPYMDSIRIIFERYHRGVKFIPTTTDLPQEGIPVQNMTEIYNSVMNHLMENSGGRAHLDNGLQFGLDYAFAFLRDVFNPLSDYGSPRLNLHSNDDSDSRSTPTGEELGLGTNREREVTLVRLAAIQQHLQTLDIPAANVGNDGIFSTFSRAGKFEREQYSYITWGLLEELINEQFVSKNAVYLKIDSSATKIRFHENLISTDSNVCILPNKNAPRYDKGILLEGRVDLSINGISHRENPNTAGELEDDEMWLTSLFINTDLIKNVFNKTEDVQSALLELLDYISGALVDNYEFQIDARGSTAQVVDVMYSKQPETRYQFKFNQATSFIRALDIDLNHTTATQMQAIYGTSGRDHLKGPFESSITPIVPQGEDKLDLFAPDLDDEETDDTDEEIESLDTAPGEGHFGNFWIKKDTEWRNYVYPDKDTVVKHIYGSDVSGEPINSGTTIPNLTITVTLDGISGIRYWDAFNVDYVPAIYNEQGFFFVTEINHEIVAGDWVTTVRGNYRLKTVAR